MGHSPLEQFGVRPDAYDGVTTSGDVTREVVAERGGKNVFHIGPPRDISIFDEIDIRLTTVERAEYVVCSGLFDDAVETPEDYRHLLTAVRQRELFMVCANPDLVVERGDQRLYCAGALADLYGGMGGEVLYAGKPHRPIYDAALAKAATVRGAAAAPSRTLAIGNSAAHRYRRRAGLGGQRALRVRRYSCRRTGVA